MVGTFISYAYVGLLLMIAPSLERYGKEVSRKFVHIMTANWWFIVMVYFDKVFWPLLVSLSFVIVNIISYKYSIFKCIEREEDIKDKGTIYYAITMMLLVIISYCYKDIYIGLIGCLIMGYADGLAAIIGKKVNLYPYSIRGNKKSVSGSLVMFIITFCVVYGVLKYLKYNYAIGVGIFIGGIVTIVEALSGRGIDNLTVPLSAISLYILMIN